MRLRFNDSPQGDGRSTSAASRAGRPTPRPTPPSSASATPASPSTSDRAAREGERRRDHLPPEARPAVRRRPGKTSASSSGTTAGPATIRLARGQALQRQGRAMTCSLSQSAMAAARRQADRLHRDPAPPAGDADADQVQPGRRRTAPRSRARSPTPFNYVPPDRHLKVGIGKVEEG